MVARWGALNTPGEGSKLAQLYSSIAIDTSDEPASAATVAGWVSSVPNRVGVEGAAWACRPATRAPTPRTNAAATAIATLVCRRTARAKDALIVAADFQSKITSCSLRIITLHTFRD